jgi:hypothetical protein
LRGDRFSLAHIGTIELLNGFSGVSARWNPDRESNDFDINAIAVTHIISFWRGPL